MFISHALYPHIFMTHPLQLLQASVAYGRRAVVMRGGAAKNRTISVGNTRPRSEATEPENPGEPDRGVP